MTSPSSDSPGRVPGADRRPDASPVGQQSPARLVALIAGTAFVAEAAIMCVLAVLPPQPEWFYVIFDATALVLLLSPALYYFFFRPLMRQMGALRHTRHELEAHRERLEELVADRTRELARVVDSLEAEVAERRQAQKSLRARTRDLDRRVNELNCLYRIAKLAERPESPIEEVFEQTVGLTMAALGGSEAIGARILYEGREYRSPNFDGGLECITGEIKVHERVVGTLEICLVPGAEDGQRARSLQAEHRFVEAVTDVVGKIVQVRESEAAVRRALEESRRREAEVRGLLEGARAVLHHRDFADAARVIFEHCKKLVGARAGYVALLDDSGSNNEVLLLDAGGQPCSVDPNLPMPVRGLRATAYETGCAVYDNDFARSEHYPLLPAGHLPLDNVMFIPLVVAGRTLGLIGLAQKPGGFDDDDVRLATAFGELAAVALMNRRTLASLENSEKRFRSVVETANDAIVSLNAAGEVVFWNNGAEKIFGFTAEEIQGRPTTCFIPERFRPQHAAALQALVEKGSTALARDIIDIHGLRKDGSEFPAEISLSAWKTNEGHFFTAVIRDITERRQAEAQIRESLAEKEVLLQEIHHRVKNNMQVISSLLNLQAERTADEKARAMLRDSQNRVQAMALVHKTLYETASLSAFNVQKYIGDLANSLVSMYADSAARITLRVACEPVDIGLDQVVSCGLVINELLSNSLKYAFPGRRGGEVSIRLRHDDGGSILLEVADDGVGLADRRLFEQPQTLGLKLVRGLVEQQLGGTIAVDGEPGARFAIRFSPHG